MKRVGVLVEGVLPSFNKYEILNEDKLNEALKTNEWEDCEKLESEGIIKSNGVASFGFVYEDEPYVIGEVDADGKYIFYDESKDLISLHDSNIEYYKDYEPEKIQQLKDALNNILSSDNKKLLYYYSDLNLDFIDDNPDDDLVISSTPKNNYFTLYFDIEDDEEFDFDKLLFISKDIGDYKDSIGENNFRGMIAPMCEEYGILSDYEPDTCMLVTNKVIYDGKFIDAWGYAEPMYNLWHVKPFIVDGDIEHITLL